VITIPGGLYKETACIEAFNYAVANIPIGHAVLPGLIEEHAFARRARTYAEGVCRDACHYIDVRKLKWLQVIEDVIWWLGIK
jgi:hypothetical protein